MPEIRRAGRSAAAHPRAWIALLAATLSAAACGENKPENPDASDGGGDSGDAMPADAFEAGGPPQKLLLLHTNDIHSHFMGFAPEVDYTPTTPNDDATHGGMAR